MDGISAEAFGKSISLMAIDLVGLVEDVEIRTFLQRTVISLPCSWTTGNVAFMILTCSGVRNIAKY